MGSSPSATLFYGVIPSSTDECDLSRPWALALPDFDGDEFDEDQALVALLGWKSNVEHVHEKVNPAQHALWLASVREKHALIKECPIRFVMMGYEGEGGYAVAIRGSVTRVDDWECKPIPHTAMFPGASWKADLERWREILKIPAEQWGEPRWYLMATYG